MECGCCISRMVDKTLEIVLYYTMYQCANLYEMRSIYMSLPIVAIVGRPNVGKSTLFNKLIGQRLSIVEDTPGVTRDRIYAKCEWLGHEFMLVDTGGIEPESDDIILAQMRRQAELAILKADVTILVTDLKCGGTRRRAGRIDGNDRETRKPAPKT